MEALRGRGLRPVQLHGPWRRQPRPARREARPGDVTVSRQERKSATACSASTSTTASRSRRLKSPMPCIEGAERSDVCAGPPASNEVDQTATRRCLPSSSRGHHQALRRARRQRRDRPRARARRDLALLGENGAGKTTLMNILFGHYVADEGRSRRRADGRCAAPRRVAEAALAAGIGMVHQHFTLAENLTVLDNIVLGTEPLWGSALGRGGARAQVGGSCGEFGLAVDLDVPVARSLGGRAPARRDPEGALPRRPRSDPRRADRGADAAGGRGAVRHAAAAGGARAGRHLHLATSCGEVLALPIASSCCAAGARSADRPAQGADRRDARRTDGRPQHRR